MNWQNENAKSNDEIQRALAWRTRHWDEIQQKSRETTFRFDNAIPNAIVHIKI